MKIVKSFHRVYLRRSELEACKRFYLKMQGLQRPHHEFHYETYRLDIVAIGSVLLIAGDPADTERFEPTKMTCLVDDLDAVRDFLIETGVKIIDELKQVPSGRNLRAMNPEGTIVEYVQHSEEFKRRMSGNAYD